MTEKLLIIAMFFITSVANSQVRMEDIEVNMKNTATLNFSEKIDFVIFGDNPQDQTGKFKYYEVFQKNNTCTFKALKVDAPETSLTVKLEDGKIFYGVVKIGSNCKIFYDYTEKVEKKSEVKNSPVEEKGKVEEKKDNENSEPSVSDDRRKERLSRIVEDKDKYFNFGVKQNGLMFQVSNIRNDSKYTYIKLRIKNRTGNDFSIDGIHLRYYLGKRKGVKRNEVGNEERILIVEKLGADVIKAYSEEIVAVAANVFAVGEDGKLILKLEEKDGNRNATMEIDGTELKNIEVY